MDLCAQEGRCDVKGRRAGRPAGRQLKPLARVRSVWDDAGVLAWAQTGQDRGIKVEALRHSER